MRADVAMEALRGAASFASKVAARPQHSVASLTHVCISASKSRLVVRASSYEMWASCAVDAVADDPLEFAVPAADFNAYCRVAPKSGRAVLEAEGTSLVISCGGTRVKLPTIDPRELPEQAVDPSMNIADVDATFSSALACASIVAPSSDGRYYLNGVFLDGDQCVGYDGFRMVVAGSPCGAGVIIPKQAIPLIVDILANGGRFGATERAWTAESDGRILSGRTIEGSFPSYRGKLDSPDVANAPIVASFSRDNMAEAIKRATLADNREVLIKGGRGNLVVSTHYMGKSARLEAEASAECDGEARQEFEVTINARYAIDALAAMPDADVVMSIADAVNMVIFRPSDGSAFLHRAAYVARTLR